MDTKKPATVTDSNGLSRRVSGVRRGTLMHLTVDGEQVEAHEGESVAAALLAAGRRTLRLTERLHEPRGTFCGMGICFECAMRINGRRGMLACRTQVADGMRVETSQVLAELESPS